MEHVSPEDAGQERVMAAAKQILKSLAVSKNAADDMMHFLSTFDPRLHPLSSPETGEEEASGADDDREELEEEIAAAEEVILRWSSSSPSSGGMIADYLYAVDDAIAASGRSARAAAAVHAAMPRLEEEARSLLSSSSSLRRLSLSSDDLGDATPDASPRHDGTLSPTAAASVGAVAARMLRAGYGPELAQVYVATRRDALAESIALLGVEAVAIEEVLRMEWSALDQRMRRWSHAVRAVVRTFLADERRLCDEVFASDEDLGNECFADVARGCVLQLLAFADAVAVSPRATEKLYRTLGMYEALADVRPELEALFLDDDAREFFAGEVSSTVQQLGSTVRHTIEEFSHAIHGEASRKPVHGGEIHPMTRYVLNYCGLLADCRSTLDAVLGDAGLDDTATAAAAASTPSARCIRELLTLLLRNIDDKSRLYDDAGLQNIFLMNNLYYVVQKVRESAPLRELVGDDWLRRHRGQIRQYETGYLRASWAAVLSQLRRDDGASARPPAGHRAPSGPSAKSFNAAFQELYRTQTAWKVADAQLREELRIAVSERLIPAYRAFLGQGSRHPARHVKCSLEDLEDYMLDFFEGAQKFVSRIWRKIRRIRRSPPSHLSPRSKQSRGAHFEAGVGCLGVILSSRRSSRSRSRHPSFSFSSPFNAEPHRSALVASYITPVDFFYKRNHGPIPKVEDLSRYTVSISGLVNKSIQLSMGDIWALPKYNVTATLQCAGNRRTAMSNVRKVRGVGWDISALGTATWGGAKLSDVLELVGIPKLSAVTSLGGKHVEFVSVDKCKEEKGGPYTASIPLKQATDPDADVLLAYEMNGEVLNRDHGYPLRVVVPGVIGARSVKWLDSINIKEEECQGFFMQKDYKMFPPTVDWDNINWSTRRPQMDFPVQSAICTLEDVDVIKEGKARIAGYALSGGGRGIERVDISVDGGKTWVEARRYQKDNVAYVSDGPQSDKWAWVLFEATVDIPANAEIIAKAVDSAANVQPEKVEDIWNLRGILNTSWHRIKIQNSSSVGRSKM